MTIETPTPLKKEGGLFGAPQQNSAAQKAPFSMTWTSPLPGVAIRQRGHAMAYTPSGTHDHHCVTWLLHLDIERKREKHAIEGYALTNITYEDDGEDGHHWIIARLTFERVVEVV